MTDETSPPNDPRAELAQKQTSMATLRTQLVLDRTTLAWVRTTLTMASFGFGMVTFFRSHLLEQLTPENIRLHHGAIRFGTALLILGIVATLLACGSHWQTLRQLKRGEPPKLGQWPLSITVALFLAAIGLVGLWAVFIR